MSDARKILEIRPGRVAALFPPILAAGEPDSMAVALIRQALDLARENGVLFVQSLLNPEAERQAAWLKSCDFSYLTEVLYLVCPRTAFSSAAADDDLQFAAFDDSPEMRKRRSELILRTYEQSRDCPEMNGLRTIDDVLASYRAVGTFDPRRWQIARRNNIDVGCLLLAEHPAESEWEIVYMGVVPEFRGQGLGLKFVRHAQFLAAAARAERLVLGVDAANAPARCIYAAGGFKIQHARLLFVLSKSNGFNA